MKKNTSIFLIISLLGLAHPAYSAVQDPVISQHTFQKGEKYHLDLRSCEQGVHPIVISYSLNMSTPGSIENTEYVQKDGSNYFTVQVEKDTEGVFAQFCNPINISPYFKKIKTNNAESQ